MKRFDIPIVLVIYKRSETLSLIIQELKKVNASKIYVIADGPKNDSENEDILKARKVIESIDWDCNIIKIYSEKNLGIYIRFLSGIDYIFNYEEKIIILEDDCIPNESFFYFVSIMLGKYEDDKQVSLISGTNYGLKLNIESDYDFCNYPLIWGWATWRRSWNEFRKLQPLTLASSNLKELKKTLENKVAYFHWKKLFLKTQNGLNSNWDHEMAFHLFTDGKLCVIPKSNFVSNQGVDQHSTHVKSKNKHLFTSYSIITKELVDPNLVKSNKQINKLIEREVYSGGAKSYLSYIVQTLYNLF